MFYNYVNREFVVIVMYYASCSNSIMSVLSLLFQDIGHALMKREKKLSKKSSSAPPYGTSTAVNNSPLFSVGWVTVLANSTIKPAPRKDNSR